MLDPARLQRDGKGCDLDQEQVAVIAKALTRKIHQGAGLRRVGGQGGVEDIVVARDLNKSHPAQRQQVGEVGEGGVTGCFDLYPFGAIGDHSDAGDFGQILGRQASDVGSHGQLIIAGGGDGLGNQPGIGGLGAEFETKRGAAFPVAQAWGSVC